jgi:hypothetical protein
MSADLASVRASLRRHVLNECRNDDVSLWSVIWTATYLMPEADDDTRRQLSLDVIQELLQDGLIVAGIPKPDGQGFDRWDLSVPETMDRITRELAELGREPDVGEIVWFTTPD